MTIKEDPIIDEIRRVRHQISEAHDHDPQKVIDYYIELQKKYSKQTIKD